MLARSFPATTAISSPFRLTTPVIASTRSTLKTCRPVSSFQRTSKELITWSGPLTTRQCYVTEDAVTKRNDKFFRHLLGSHKSDLLYEEKDELFDIGAERS